MNNDWRDGFLFVGNHLLLDFLNTRPVMDGEAVEMLPDGGALARWLAAARIMNEMNEREGARLMRRWAGPEFNASMTQIRELRETARQTVLKIEEGASVGTGVIKDLNRLLIAYPDKEQVIQTGSDLERRRLFAPEIPEHAFAPLADAFADLLTVTPASRLRKCDACVLHFYDTSKKGTRVWCSMNLCGNRAKVAAYADRKREAEKNTHGRHKTAMSKKV